MEKSCPNRPSNYVVTLKQIHENDLKFVEKDLAFYEKVSVVFLLYGSDIVQAHYALQNLLILSRSPTAESELLYNYTKYNKNWRQYLIEALTIIKAHKVLRKLGFDAKDLRKTFLPHIPQVTLYIHPILKALYIMCEKLTKAKAGKIILEIKNSNESANALPFYNSQYFEIFLLDWMTKSIICIGEYSTPIAEKKFNTFVRSGVNLSKLYECLKLCGCYEIKETLENTAQHMNKQINIEQSESEKRETKELFNRNENDSVLVAANNTFERKESYVVYHNECYSIRKKYAGIILIINQAKFYRDTNPEVQDVLPDPPLPERRGTEIDKVRLEETLSSFGYIAMVKNNITNIEMLNEIRDVVKKSEVFDSVIVAILSHGIQGAVYGSNSIAVELQRIQEILASDSLLGKPKLLIIQACQGEGLQRAKPIEKFEYDAPPSVPAFSDMLTATSTVPGFASVRHIEKGTWFIQTLCKVIDTQGDRTHMLDLLTSVISEVSRKRGNENQCMVPLTCSTLSKKFYLPKRF